MFVYTMFGKVCVTEVNLLVPVPSALNVRVPFTVAVVWKTIVVGTTTGCGGVPGGGGGGGARSGGLTGVKSELNPRVELMQDWEPLKE